MDVATPQALPKRPPKGIPPDDDIGGGREPENARTAERSPTRSLQHLPLRKDSLRQDDETASTTSDPDPISRRPIRQTYASAAAP